MTPRLTGVKLTGTNKKADRSYTILIVPHSGDKPLSFPFHAAWLKAAVGALAVVALSTCVFAVKYVHMSWTIGRNRAELSVLRSENSTQKEMLERLQQEAAQVEEKLKRLEDLDAQIRDIITRERSLLSSRGNPSQMAARSRERALAMAEVSRDGASRRQSVFGGAIDQATSLETSLAADLKEIKELITYLRAKPSSWPTLGAVTSGFGVRRSPITRSRDFHEGLDIGAPYGAPVLAAGDGSVVTAAWYGGLGRTVIIDHGYGIRSWYGHLSRIQVKVGQKVQRGQVIGAVGSSGSSTGPHLHFQVTIDGKCVDPEDFLSSSDI